MHSQKTPYRSRVEMVSDIRCIVCMKAEVFFNFNTVVENVVLHRKEKMSMFYIWEITRVFTVINLTVKKKVGK